LAPPWIGGAALDRRRLLLLHWIDYFRPDTLDACLEAFAEHGANARALAGGTDLLVQMRAGRMSNSVVIDLKAVPEFNELRFDPSAGLTLGAAVPCYRIYGDETVQREYPGLIDSVSMIGGTQIQGRASVGGNLCNASPSADAVPALIALGATCRVASVAGEREVPVEEFCSAPGRNVLGEDEVLVSLNLPAPSPSSGACYLRFIPRNEMDIAVAGSGVSVRLADGCFASGRVALAAVAPTPLLVPAAGAALRGQPIGRAAIAAAAAAAREAASPISDMRGTAEYRSNLCEVLTRRALETAVERAGGTLG
jgi:carbon-monoxide dehydrogenase medium subunit